MEYRRREDFPHCRVGRAVGRYFYSAGRDSRKHEERARLALPDILRRKGKAEHEYPFAGDRIPGKTHHRRYLYWQRQGALEPGMEQATVALPRGPAQDRLSA